MSRDSIRSKLLGSSPRSVLVDIDDIQIEVRQPTVGDLLKGIDNPDQKGGLMIQSVIDHCYVPGTNERVFEPEDIEALQAMPFGDSWLKITKALDGLMDYDRGVKEAAKNS